MSKIDELIRGLCLDDVPRVPLKEAAILQRGTAVTQKTIETGSYPVIAGGQRPAYYNAAYNREGETITVAGSGAYAGYVAYWNEPIFVSDAFSVKAAEGNSTKYIYYALEGLQDKIYAAKKGGGVPHVHISDIENLSIPLPPLPIQREIVRILDTFSELTSELTAELTAELALRKKQYAFYRDKLLSFDERVERVKLGELEASGVLALGRGNVISKKELQNNPGNYPVYSSSAMGDGEIGRYGNYMFDDERITWSIDGGGKFFYRNGIRYSVTNVGGWIKVNSASLNTKFLYYVLSSQWENQKFDYVRKAHPSVIKDIYDIPLPPLSEQQRIVAILDRFDTLCNDLTGGIPAEIEARKKQYAYYRDLLLRFDGVA